MPSGLVGMSARIVPTYSENIRMKASNVGHFKTKVPPGGQC